MKQQRSRAIVEESFRAHLAAAQLVVKRAAFLAGIVAAMPALLIGGFMAVAGSLLDGATMFVMIFAEVGLFASIIPLIVWFQRVRIPRSKIRESIDHDDAITYVERLSTVSFSPARLLVQWLLFRSLERVVAATDAGLETRLLLPPDVASRLVAAHPAGAAPKR